MNSKDYYTQKAGGLANSDKVGWSSTQSQEAGFAAVTSILSASDVRPRILDVGAGLGDLQSWMMRKGIVAEYTGVEPMEHFVKSAEVLGRKVFQGYGENLGGYKCDYAVAHGTFNVGADIPVSSIIKSMWEAADKGIAFTMLEERPSADFNAFNPEGVKKFCEELSPKPSSVEVRAYWPGQFVVKVTK